MAVASPLPERRIRPALEHLQLLGSFSAVITAEDNGTADLEVSYLTAAHQLQRPPLRCIVIGDSNRSVEAAHELGAKSVVLTGGQPAWNFGGADLVVRGLGELSFVNLKKLFAQEELVESSTNWEEVRAEERRASAEDEYGLPEGWQQVSTPRRSSSIGSSSSSSSSTQMWEPMPQRAPSPALRPAPAIVREREPALAGAVAMQLEDEDEGEEMDVILPPKGSAFWDLQR